MKPTENQIGTGTTTTTTPAVAPTPSVALVKVVTNSLDANAKAEGAQMKVVTELERETSRLGLERKGAKLLADAAYLAAYNSRVKNKADRVTELPHDLRPIVSKTVTMVFPSKPDAKAAIVAYNAENPTKPVGINSLYAVCTGAMTADEAIAKREGKGQPNPMADTRSPDVRFADAFRNVVEAQKIGSSDKHVSHANAAKIATKVLADWKAAQTRAAKAAK